MPESIDGIGCRFYAAQRGRSTTREKTDLSIALLVTRSINDLKTPIQNNEKIDELLAWLEEHSTCLKPLASPEFLGDENLRAAFRTGKAPSWAIPSQEQFEVFNFVTYPPGRCVPTETSPASN